MNLISAKNLLYMVSLAGLYFAPMNYSVGSGNITQPFNSLSGKKFKIKITSKKIYNSNQESTILTKNTDKDIKLDTLYNKDSYKILNNNIPSELFTFNKDKYSKVLKGSVQRSIKAGEKKDKKRISYVSISKLRKKNKSYVNLKKGKVHTEEQVKNNYKSLITDARSFISQGDISLAEKKLKQAMLYSFNNAWNLTEIAGSFEKINRYEFASEAYKRALGQKPNRIEIMFSYAVCLRKDNKLDKSKQILKKLIEIKPEFMLAHFNLGSIYYKKAMYYNSLDSFYTSVKLNPLSIDAYYNIAYILEKLNESKLAKRYYAKCIKLNPKDRQSKNALLRLGRKYSKRYRKNYKSS